MTSFRRQKSEQGVFVMTKHKWPYCAVILSIFLLVTQANGQNKTEQSGAQSISQTGLLPIYGVDFAFDYSWIDSAQFPSKSTQYPNQGVNATFQQIWEALKPGGFNVIRFPVDVRDTQAAAIRVANLCVWARRNNVKLVAVLGGAERGKQLGPDFSTSVSGFVRALLVTLRANGQQQELYSQILAYQLENEMNHQGLHGAMSAEAAQ